LFVAEETHYCAGGDGDRGVQAWAGEVVGRFACGGGLFVAMVELGMGGGFGRGEGRVRGVGLGVAVLEVRVV
jgi:hypothetical protein